MLRSRHPKKEGTSLGVKLQNSWGRIQGCVWALIHLLEKYGAALAGIGPSPGVPWRMTLIEVFAPVWLIVRGGDKQMTLLLQIVISTLKNKNESNSIDCDGARVTADK